MPGSNIGTLTIEQITGGRYRVVLVLDVERFLPGETMLVDAVSSESVHTESRRPDQSVRDARESDPRRLLLTVEQAAEHLSIGRGTIYELLRSGQLESVKIGRLRRVPYQALEAYVDRMRRAASPS
jgi:excisionase family DNA binding protein